MVSAAVRKRPRGGAAPLSTLLCYADVLFGDILPAGLPAVLRLSFRELARPSDRSFLPRVIRKECLPAGVLWAAASQLDGVFRGVRRPSVPSCNVNQQQGPRTAAPWGTLVERPRRADAGLARDTQWGLPGRLPEFSRRREQQPDDRQRRNTQDIHVRGEGRREPPHGSRETNPSKHGTTGHSPHQVTVCTSLREHTWPGAPGGPRWSCRRVRGRESRRAPPGRAGNQRAQQVHSPLTAGS